jgi:NAD(P)-dependent dehydrogenase (short-subunit alcohol dehydrogenase family)
MSMEITDRRVALVTGAGRGIGRAHALTLASRGHAVVVNDIGAALDGSGRDDSPAQSVVDEIVAAGGTAIADSTDIASVAGGRSAVAVAIAAYGRIDIVVNNAGFAHGGGDIEAPDTDQLTALLAVHYLAAVGTMSAAFADMKQRGWGRIVNTVSEVALDTRMPGSLGYGAAKAALWSATITAARTGAPFGITVNAISPGARTRMNEDLLDAGALGSRPMPDLNPQHVADVVAYLASDDAGDITGRIIHAAGGAIREYSTSRSSKTELVARLSALVS